MCYFSFQCAATVLQTSSMWKCCVGCLLVVRKACPLNSSACCRVIGRKSAAFQLLQWTNIFVWAHLINIFYLISSCNIYFCSISSLTFTAVFYLHMSTPVSWQFTTAIPALIRQLIIMVLMNVQNSEHWACMHSKSADPVLLTEVQQSSSWSPSDQGPVL